MPTLNPGPGEPMVQDRTIAGAAANDTEVYMTHMSVVEKAIAMKKGNEGIDAMAVVKAIAGNKVTLNGRKVSDNSEIHMDGMTNIQVIAWGY